MFKLSSSERSIFERVGIAQRVSSRPNQQPKTSIQRKVLLNRNRVAQNLLNRSLKVVRQKPSELQPAQIQQAANSQPLIIQIQPQPAPNAQQQGSSVQLNNRQNYQQPRRYWRHWQQNQRQQNYRQLRNQRNFRGQRRNFRQHRRNYRFVRGQQFFRGQQQAFRGQIYRGPRTFYSRQIFQRGNVWSNTRGNQWAERAPRQIQYGGYRRRF